MSSKNSAVLLKKEQKHPLPLSFMINNLIRLIGNTPLVEIRHSIQQPGVRIFGKLEGQNPGGSIKDRAALYMIEGAMARGELRAGMRMVEATSGNTGIALAMIAPVFDLGVTIVMPDDATAERVQTMRGFGAEVILTPAAEGMPYARNIAESMAAAGTHVLLNQFVNPDNWRAHYATTGPEIWADTKGNITHFVASLGTTGTMMGVSRFLKTQNPAIQMIGMQPTENSDIPGVRRWVPDEPLPNMYEPDRVDRIIEVSTDESIAMMRRLAREDAIFSGVSSGGIMAAVAKLVTDLPEALVVAIVCDRGDRYLSSGVFMATDEG
jgi:S-sulfo-L-cysteine synthase (O-acetyl-L-serine-dependent)